MSTDLKSTKFKVGDYITAPDKVFLRVIAVIDSGLGAVYLLNNHKSNNNQWESQYELDQDKIAVGQPDFEGASKLKAGDILNLGSPEQTNYATVLARVGDAVLLSQTADKQKANMLLKMDEQIQRMGEEFGKMMGAVLDDDERARIKKMGSSIHASKLAGEWFDVRNIALMNWQILGDE